MFFLRVLVGFTAVLLGAGPAAHAAAPEKLNATPLAAPSYAELRQTYQGQLGRCDLTNAQDVLSITAKPIANLKENPKKWLTLLEETKTLRQGCYQKTQDTLEEAISAGLVATQNAPENAALAAQLELDKQTADFLNIRQQLSSQILESMANDLSTTLKTYKKTRSKKKRPSFVVESAKTANLMRQDMGIVLEIERRQLNLQERLLAQKDETPETLVRLKLKKALHYLTRALMVYEDIGQDKPALLLATLRSEYLYATGQIHEVIAFTPNLEPLPEVVRPTLLQLANRMQLLELDVEGALRDYQNGMMEQKTDVWLSELYQDLSTLSGDLNTVLQHLELGDPITAQEGDNLKIPEDIAAFIHDEAQKKPENTPEQKEKPTNKKE